MPPFLLDRAAWFRRTLTLSPAARGCYLDFVLACWAEPEARFTANQVRQVARVTDRRVWVKLWHELVPLLVGTEESGWIDPWTHELYRAALACSAMKAVAGRQSVTVRRARFGSAQPRTPAEQTPNTRSNTSRTAPEHRAEHPPNTVPNTRRTEPEHNGLNSGGSAEGVAASGSDPVRSVQFSADQCFSQESEQPDPESAGASPQDQVQGLRPDVQMKSSKPPEDPHLSRTRAGAINGHPVLASRVVLDGGQRAGQCTDLRTDLRADLHAADESTVPVLTALAHTILDELDANVIPPITLPEIRDELKTRAALAQIPATATACQQALDAAEWQRPRQSALQCAIRLLRSIVAVPGPRGLAAQDVRAEVYRQATRQYPSAAFDAWRDEVIRLAWEETTWRTAPVLEFDGERLKVRT